MRIRIKFRKYGVMRFIGHLDIMRYFQKVMRRADIDICYSEGFSPHQIMSFAAPLGVGITSDGEYLDIEVHSSLSSADSIKALNAANVDGIEVSEYVALPDGAKKAMTAVAAADYFVYFKKNNDLDIAGIKKCIAQYYTSRNEILVVKQTKKSEREVDLKPLIYEFNAMEEDDRTGFFLKLSTGSVDNIKPELVLEDMYRFFGIEFDESNLQIHRIEVYEQTEHGLSPLYKAGYNIEKKAYFY